MGVLDHLVRDCARPFMGGTMVDPQGTSAEGEAAAASRRPYDSPQLVRMHIDVAVCSGGSGSADNNRPPTKAQV